MSDHGIHIKELPKLKNPLLIAGFDGWGNALNISKGMVNYLIRRMKAKHFADLDPDTFYRYDDQRPQVSIVGGILKSFRSPGGSFYAAQTDAGQSDLVILKADEPNLRWFQLADQLFLICQKLGIRTVITLGSMYDNVLHTDRIVSGVASTEDVVSRLMESNINPIDYQGPSAIHTIIHSEGSKRGFECISLWSHCPYYLQGTTHFGLLSHMGRLIAELANFQIDTPDLEAKWRKLKEQINRLIDGNSELQSLISSLRKEKLKGTTTSLKGTLSSDKKIINLKDFLDPK
ncbi:MAG: PAC2 family protein [Desulfobacteraceae bacterium]|jgi:proteasome assembly chaperone (PAC2) family protein|nr:PAC2 family protein [Desulfobacteraceae bacterium]